MLRDIMWMLREIPVWFRVVMVVVLIAGTASTVYAFKECGWKALLLGNGAATAALMGMCD